MAEPRRCPICNGTGKVAADFYDEPGTSTTRVACRSCNGSGIVWDYSVSNPIPSWPHYPDYPSYPQTPPWVVCGPNTTNPYPNGGGISVCRDKCIAYN